MRRRTDSDEAGGVELGTDQRYGYIESGHLTIIVFLRFGSKAEVYLMDTSALWFSNFDIFVHQTRQEQIVGTSELERGAFQTAH